MKILTATVTDVPVGYLTIPGLMDEHSEFYVGVPQIAEQFQFPVKHASRDIKSLLGKDFEFPKLKTPLNPKAINAVPLDRFESLLFELALKGNEGAISFSRMLIGLSLRQLFSDAFKVKFEEEERQEFLKWRQITRLDFHPVLTDSIQRNVNPNPNEWGKYIKQFQDSQGVESGTRDKLPPEKLARLAIAQNTAAVLLDAGLPWGEVLDRISA